MKLRNVTAIFGEKSYVLTIQLYSESSNYFFDVENLDVFNSIVDVFGDLEIFSLTCFDNIYLNFYLDKNLFDEFKKFLVNGGF